MMRSNCIGASSIGTQFKPFHLVGSNRWLIASSYTVKQRFDRQFRRNTVLSSTAPSGEGAVSNSAFDIVFGKPSAPRELYERIANDSREGS